VVSGCEWVSMFMRLLHYTILASGALHRDFFYLSIWRGMGCHVEAFLALE